MAIFPLAPDQTIALGQGRNDIISAMWTGPDSTLSCHK